MRVLLNHRHSLVEMRTRVKNGLQALALSRKLYQGRKLGRQTGQEALQALPLGKGPAHRRQDLLQRLAQLNGWIGELDEQLAREAVR